MTTGFLSIGQVKPKLTAPDLSEEDLDAMVRAFAVSIDQGRGEEWMKTVNTYAFSKIAVHALVRRARWRSVVGLIN